MLKGTNSQGSWNQEILKQGAVLETWKVGKERGQNPQTQGTPKCCSKTGKEISAVSLLQRQWWELNVYMHLHKEKGIAVQSDGPTAHWKHQFPQEWEKDAHQSGLALVVFIIFYNGIFFLHCTSKQTWFSTGYCPSTVFPCSWCSVNISYPKIQTALWRCCSTLSVRDSNKNFTLIIMLLLQQQE